MLNAFKINDQISGNIKIGGKSRLKKRPQSKLSIYVFYLYCEQDRDSTINHFHGSVNQSLGTIESYGVLLITILNKKCLLANIQLVHFLI